MAVIVHGRNPEPEDSVDFQERDYHYLQAAPGDGRTVLDHPEFPEAVIYVHVCRGSIRAPHHLGDEGVCNLLFAQYNSDRRPDAGRFRSMSVGDVLVLDPRDGELPMEQVFICAPEGWRTIGGGVAGELRGIAERMAWGPIPGPDLEEALLDATLTTKET